VDAVTDFLLELRSEEIPARMQDRARADLEKLFVAELDKAGLKAGAIVTYATPRRLTLIARDLPEATAAVSEELKGPPADAPDAAVEGFLRKAGLTRDALETREVKGRATLFAVIERAGRPTAELLAEAIPAIVRAFPWPKSMRWGAASISTESLRWVRPLQGIVALFGDDVVECEVAGIRSGRETVGHRFHHDGVITIGSAQDYVEKLRACHVVVDQDERRTMIRLAAKELAADAGLTLIEDEGLVAENAGLTEWPVPLLGRFDPEFLEVPPEVIQLTARVNQKYFVCADADGKLANAFVCTANIAASDGGAKIVEGNQKVLAARLSDARFFYDTDLKVPLEEQAKKLDRIVFHKDLGTVAAKVERMTQLAQQMSSPAYIPNCDPELAMQAAQLAKADLVTGMVGEFPELQGTMGRYYAEAQNKNPAVARAIQDHYSPIGQNDKVPTDPVSIAVSLADKIDSIAGFFYHGMFPTGSKDPFALRRAAIGIYRIIVENKLQGNFKHIISYAVTLHAEERFDALDEWHVGMKQARNLPLEQLLKDRTLFPTPELAERDLSQYNQDRLKFTQDVLGHVVNIWDDFIVERARQFAVADGIDYQLASAAFAGESNLASVAQYLKILSNFMKTDDGANLLSGYKRATRILDIEGGVPEGQWTNPSPAPAEAALIAALDEAEPLAAAAMAEERFEDAMSVLAGLREPIDQFFDKGSGVLVNDPHPPIRAARLALLARMRDAVHQVADFSRIEG
jgi:glycyl-tRNA synthetase beta chain